MRSYQNMVITCLLVAVLAAIWIPTVFGNIATDPWVKWIYNFQALITGFVAAGAAYLTVREMRRSTDKQLEIFSKQLLLQQLPEKRRMRQCYEELRYFDIHLSLMSMQNDFVQTRGDIDIINMKNLLHSLDWLADYCASFVGKDYIEIPVDVQRDFKSEVVQLNAVRTNLRTIVNNEKIVSKKIIHEIWNRAIILRNGLERAISDIQEWILKEYPEINSTDK